jgi:hypothetical protein
MRRCVLWGGLGFATHARKHARTHWLTTKRREAKARGTEGLPSFKVVVPWIQNPDWATFHFSLFIHFSIPARQP